MSESGPKYVLAVRALCEFTAKQGDLDLRFTPSPTAQQGVAGHTLVRSRRAAGYQTEVALSGDFGPLRVRGRADGYDPAAHRLEEIKTYRGRLDTMPDNQRQLHWAQLKIYGWLMCQSRTDAAAHAAGHEADHEAGHEASDEAVHEAGLDAIELALVYFDIDRQRETVLTETASASSLRDFFETCCAQFLAWAARELTHRAARDVALRALRFPHADFRAGQRQFAEAIYRGALRKHRLLAQAPTGIGKTVGSLFPLLKAGPDQHIDKIFYLAAKTSGRRMAIDAIRQLCARDVPDARMDADGEDDGKNNDTPAPGHDARPMHAVTPLRVVELVARDKACEHPELACHGESCPLAKGFYDRLPAARDAAIGTPILDQSALRDVAREHAVCPYYLGQEMAKWSDLIVGDYNYYFDLNAMLFALAQANQWRVSMLVDEAHNLLERARGMYSATLDPASLREARRAAPAALKRALSRVARDWKALSSVADGAGAMDAPDAPDAPTAPVAADLPHDHASDRFSLFPGVRTTLLPSLQHAIVSITDCLAAHPATTSPALLTFLFDAIHFVRVAELFDQDRFSDTVERGRRVPHTKAPHTRGMFDRFDSATVPTGTDADAGARRGGAAKSSMPTLTLRNIVPAALLKPRFAAAHSVTLFSATLTPWRFYADTLGLPDDSVWSDVQSPFRAEQLRVRVVDAISTRWRDREASLHRLVDLIARQYEQRPGNYLGFFSSYDYLQRASASLRARYPTIPLRVQSPGMREAEQTAFLNGFTTHSRDIGFAVLGGAFGEGVDLPGDRLIGAFIATLGLPQWSPFNEEIKACMANVFGQANGYNYAYLFPGIRKVVQAAGRVIRTPDDTGVVYLIDDRFARAEVRRLLPTWWEVQRFAT